jgi:hypothetical protein|uniref:Uncharacterized protein n=1 Tax=Eutreptiella gymnastica TaxID=73025 RepID=A0A7S4LEC8_9EUGL|mmetsp:Transcript_6633/g.12540  ORF Transcript_6633/g.12540 Transcript_6633/m.12540 type:complete len:107 (+) Transcript_6633:1164-1484(+)|eukprot:CAMPEP_0174301716 /NCGR_PEP_ID=MMETSP0809-20121228/59204_1 /TAXON_ID=73025 ORGANISM="Eutreptiella gymnastica-like, Strain CCMP1594" /NCGR_SAMPLE_ID=MMETSP0809 /ASSEMBLY_ACC=CAM_ASM_000658 /LENGTH=106 /DNA_ID=CAMNT_0015407505 /DNA_START=3089 /DNA_END=3409 /DNA_ORIENTATION=-
MLKDKRKDSAVTGGMLIDASQVDKICRQKKGAKQEQCGVSGPASEMDCPLQVLTGMQSPNQQRGMFQATLWPCACMLPATDLLEMAISSSDKQLELCCCVSNGACL